MSTLSQQYIDHTYQEGTDPGMDKMQIGLGPANKYAMSTLLIPVCQPGSHPSDRRGRNQEACSIGHYRHHSDPRS